MPTYAQLQAESWWGREVTTPAIDWLGDQLCRRTGRPAGAFGNKGDNNHLRGGHRSQEWILKSRYCTSRTYTVQAGLTAAQQRHLGGVDFTPGSDSQMIAQCKRIYAAVRSGQLEEVREFYGNVDGDKVVDGWDNVRDRAASSDSSHLWHWHLTLDRRHCANKPLMERILAIALGDDVEDDVDDATIERIAKRSAQLTLQDGGMKYLMGRVHSLTTGVEPVTATGETNVLHQRLAELVDRPPVQSAPVDVAALAEQLAPALEAAAERAVARVLKRGTDASPAS